MLLSTSSAWICRRITDALKPLGEEYGEMLWKAIVIYMHDLLEC